MMVLRGGGADVLEDLEAVEWGKRKVSHCAGWEKGGQGQG